MVCITVQFSHCFLFCSLKNTRCYAEIWSKAAYNNEIPKKFCDCWGLTPVDLTNYSHVKNYTLQQMRLKHYYPKLLEMHTEAATSNCPLLFA